jgi:hypothetical protein
MAFGACVLDDDMEVDDAQEIDANTAAARAGYRFRVHYM